MKNNVNVKSTHRLALSTIIDKKYAPKMPETIVHTVSHQPPQEPNPVYCDVKNRLKASGWSKTTCAVPQSSPMAK